MLSIEQQMAIITSLQKACMVVNKKYIPKIDDAKSGGVVLDLNQDEASIWEDDHLPQDMIQ